MDERGHFQVPGISQETPESTDRTLPRIPPEEKIRALKDKIREQEAEIERIKRDSLTGLKPRPDAEAAKEIKKRRERSGKPWTALMLDIDRFKTINDRYGHATGDEVIQLVANYLKQHFREEDVAMRWGGEEFVVLCRDAAPQDIVNKLYNKKDRRPELSFEIEWKGNKIPVTLSGGLTSFEKEDELADAVKRADEALYWAKTHGRNQIADYDALPPEEERN